MKRIALNIFFLFLLSKIYAQPLKRIEYFFDTDPGIGLGIPLMDSLAGYNLSKEFSISAEGLSAGPHKVYVRSISTDNRASLSEGRDIFILNRITRAEYFYDTDPGTGNGRSLGIYPNGDSLTFTPELSAYGVSSGPHYLYIRTMDAGGQWSLAEARPLSIQNTMRRAEYFYDTDPGPGNGIAFNLPYPTDSVTYTEYFEAGGLTSGKHMLFIRVKDANNRWSLAEGREINIKKHLRLAEYFFDTDPGFGLGHSLSFLASGDSIEEVVSISAAGLSAGKHMMYIRSLDTDRKWSLTEARTVEIKNTITAAEYFYDTDPGTGNGTPLTISGLQDSLTWNPQISAAGLSSGTHYLYIRSKNANGSWSLSEGRPVTIQNTLNALEYFVDKDPGQGNGVQVEIPPLTDSLELQLSLPAYSLPAGKHILYFRSCDSNGKWSLSEPRPFETKSSPRAAIKLFLQGFYSGNETMVAVVDPYNQPNLCDTITVELHDAKSPFQVRHSTKAILSTQGISGLDIPEVLFGKSFYIVVKHRNSLETWSKTPVRLDQDVVTYNFSGTGPVQTGN